MSNKNNLLYCCFQTQKTPNIYFYFKKNKRSTTALSWRKSKLSDRLLLEWVLLSEEQEFTLRLTIVLIKNVSIFVQYFYLILCFVIIPVETRQERAVTLKISTRGSINTSDCIRQKNMSAITTPTVEMEGKLR